MLRPPDPEQEPESAARPYGLQETVKIHLPAFMGFVGKDRFDSKVPQLGGDMLLGGGFKHVCIFTFTWENDPIWLIFLNWAETTN